MKKEENQLESNQVEQVEEVVNLGTDNILQKLARGEEISALELQSLISDLQKKIHSLKLKSKIGQLEKTHYLSRLRKEVARLKTVLRNSSEKKININAKHEESL